MNASHESRPLPIELKPVETLVARTELVAMGRFVCPSSHPLFPDSGPCSHHTIVFPRTATAVRCDDGATFVADPTTVLFYNQHLSYSRSKVSEVDECDWFVISSDLLVEVLAAYDEAARDRFDRPFRHACATAEPLLFLAQRRLFDAVASGEEIDALQIDETVTELLHEALRCAYARPGRRTGARHAKTAARRVEAVKRAIVADIADAPSLNRLASIAGCSPYELCRSFREVTGMRITEYRNAFRTRMALAILRQGCTDLTSLALDLGFSSHSHFTSHFRRAFGIPPSRWKARANARLRFPASANS